MKATIDDDENDEEQIFQQYKVSVTIVDHIYIYIYMFHLR